MSFDSNLKKVLPNFLSQNEVLILDDDNGFQRLLLKLNNMGEYLFPEVNPNKIVPSVQRIGLKEDKTTEYNLLKNNRYNLLVSSREDAWEGIPINWRGKDV